MQRILVVRNDKIGDFMLAWPSFAMLKASCDCHITALVPSYTAPLAELCPWIDQVILDPGAKASRSEQSALLRRLRQGQFDAAIVTCGGKAAPATGSDGSGFKIAKKMG